MLISAHRPTPSSPARVTTAKAQPRRNNVEAGDKVIISGIVGGLTAIPGVGTAVGLGVAWGAHKDGDKIPSAAFLAGGLLNSVGTASFWIGRNLGNETAASVGLAMLGAAPIAGAVGMWNSF